MTIATTESVASGVSVDHGKVLDYLGLNPSDPKSQAVVAVAQRYDLDPLLKHVIVIPRGGVYITRDGLLHVAHRSGALDGIVVEQEPKLSEDGKEWVARVSVYRKDMRHPFTFPGRYSVNGGNREYAQEMALKAAEAHALRRAFDVTGLPAIDEQRPYDEHEQPRGGLGAVLAQTSGAEAAPDDESGLPVRGDGPSASESPYLNTSSALARRMFALFGEIGLKEKPDRLAYVADVIGREVASSTEMTDADAERVIAAIERDLAQPFAPVDQPLDAELVDEPAGGAA